MPDWSYRTLFRPLLFRMSAARGRDLTLGIMARLARLPLGPWLIDLLGHMRAPAALARDYLGVRFPTPLGLGVGIDEHGVALKALARFGFGFLEVGPVTPEPVSANVGVERRPEQEALWYPFVPVSPGLEALRARLETACLPLPVMARLAPMPAAGPSQAAQQCRLMIERLAPFCDLFSLHAADDSGGRRDPDDWAALVQAAMTEARQVRPVRPVLVCVPPDLEPALAERVIEQALAVGIAGIVVDGRITVADGTLAGSPARAPALTMVRRLRERWGELVIVSSGGAHEPAHALELSAAGANLVQIDSGLVYSGPGLPKRINEAMLFAHEQRTARVTTDQAEPAARLPASQLSWFWAFLLGISMLLGGFLALGIAATRVVLPYDEVFSGMTRDELARVNDRLLAFMAHDRVSLAGTMIAIGVLYAGLSLFAIRRGQHWARVSVLASAFSGFGTFFFFLGFGYFDPFHAFVTAVLFQFLLLALYAPLGPAPTALPNLHNDWRWRRSQWGQLLLVIQGFGLIGGGLTISLVGITTVFVHEDLEFMQTTAEALAAANPRLVPLVAHDRASFGGMLVAGGIAVLLPALWGIRQGTPWLWWTFLCAGIPGYGAAIAVHYAVGYTDWWHLVPVFSGFTLLTIALILCYPYMCQRDPALHAAWSRFLPGAHAQVDAQES